MNRDALNKLADAIEAGTATGNDFGAAWPHAHYFEHTHAWSAYNGSLDAAMALHNAVLPGWRWASWASGDATVWDSIHKPYSGVSDYPARAWLLAIVRALAAMQDKDAR